VASKQESSFKVLTIVRSEAVGSYPALVVNKQINKDGEMENN